MIYHILTMNKNRKLTAQNKCGSFNPDENPTYSNKLHFESMVRT